MTRALSHLVTVAVAVAACGSPATPPQPPRPEPTTTAPADAADPVTPLPLDRDLSRLAERSVQLYQEVVKVFAATGTDCAAAASRLGALQATYAEVVRANATVLHDGRARELRVALEPHAEALDAAAKAIVQSTTMSTCATDRPFTDAFDELVGAPP